MVPCWWQEIAKLRAARRLWANLMKDKFNPKNVRYAASCFHTDISLA